jgi:hypothetical protein
MPIDLDPLLLLTAAIFMLAGMVKGLVGMGLPTIAMGLLALVMSPAQAAAILVAPSSIPSFHVTAKVSENARDCCSISAKRSMRGLSLCSGMLGIRS